MRIKFMIAAALLAAPAAALAAPPTQLIPGDGAWTLTQVPNGGCFARLAGNQADTMVMVNRFGKPVISVGRPDWSLGSSDFSAGLRINGGPERQITVSPAGTILLVAIEDDLKEQVLNATSLEWTLPNGRYSVAVSGLGKAFKAVIPCGLAAAQAAPMPTQPTS